MRTAKLVRNEDGAVVVQHCRVAEHAPQRMRGLLGRRELPADEGLLLRPASSIHTWFMRFPIDAVFLDRENVVVRVAERVAPWRVAARAGSRSVLELAAGAAARAGLREGDRLVLAD